MPRSGPIRNGIVTTFGIGASAARPGGSERSVRTVEPEDRGAPDDIDRVTQSYVSISALRNHHVKLIVFFLRPPILGDLSDGALTRRGARPVQTQGRAWARPPGSHEPGVHQETEA